jgi:hypothetical protein
MLRPAKVKALHLVSVVGDDEVKVCKYCIVQGILEPYHNEVCCTNGIDGVMYHRAELCCEQLSGSMVWDMKLS